MRKLDPGLALRCPKCPRKLVYVDSYGTEPDHVILVYHCPQHGRWIIPPDGPMRIEPYSIH